MRVVAIAALVLFSVTIQVVAQEVIPLNTPGAKKITDPASYGIGYDIGSNVAQGGLTADAITQGDFVAGFMDALSGKDPAVATKEIQVAMEALSKKLQAKASEAAKTNLAKANKYLDENKKREGVQTTASGLQYEVIKTGTGAVQLRPIPLLCIMKAS